MGGTDEKQNEYKSLRTRRELATAPAWALSRGIEMAKAENRKLSEKKGRRIWSKRVTWVLLHAVHFFQTYREVGELEIALSFALLQMSWGR